MAHHFFSKALVKALFFIVFSFLLLAINGCAISPQANQDLTESTTITQPETKTIAVEQSNPESSLEPKVAETEIISPVAEKKLEMDLWHYLANRQDLALLQHPRISRLEKQLLKHPKLLYRKTEKAAPYLYYIIGELEKRNLPLELAFTPMVESNFDPLAHSVVQAAGLWQFMPRTAKGFGLKINQSYDGRRDIVASTNAALNYYEYLNKMFDGDWLLSVAAYNLGEGNVLKAIKKNRLAGKATDYWSLKLPKETMRHVPKWIALSNILINHNNFGLDVATINNQPVFASLELDAPANLVQLAKLTKIDKEYFYRLNPAFNRLFVPKQHGKANILVPVESLAFFEDKIQNSPAELFKVSMSYQVKSGDNLSSIAKKHHSSVGHIKKINNLNTDRLQIGQLLKLPGSVDISKEEQQFFATLKKNKKRRRYKIYKVRSGDSLWKIAKRFNVSTGKLAKWNRLSTKKILRIGQQLKVWPNS